MIPDKPISFYHAGFVKFFNQGLKSSFPDSPFNLLNMGGHAFGKEGDAAKDQVNSGNDAETQKHDKGIENQENR